MEVWKHSHYSYNIDNTIRNVWEVSNYGHVKKNGVVKQYATNNYGYVICCLPYRFMHRAVATLFIPNPDNKEQVNHIDGDKTNNHVDNLEWVSQSENLKHAYANGFKKTALSIEDQIKVASEYKPRVVSIRKLANSYNVSPNAIYNYIKLYAPEKIK